MLIELPFGISDEIAQRLGILATSREPGGGEAIRLFVKKMAYPIWKGEFGEANTIEQKSKLLPGGPHRQ